MTRTSVSHQPLRMAALGAIAVVAIIAACSSRVGGDLVGPPPTGGKPIATQIIPNAGPAKPMLMGRDAVYFEYQVENPVMSAPGSPAPRYPDILKAAGVSGEVIASFVVDTTGLADVGSLKVIRSSHQLFVNSIVAAMPDMRFTPAMVGGRKVKQLVMAPFVFQIADNAKAASKLVPRHGSTGAAWRLVPIYDSTRALWKMVPSIVRPPQSR